MGIFDFLKYKNNSKPSRKHILFSNMAIEIIGNTLEKNGFEFYQKEIETYFTTIIWKKNKQYVKISASDFPTDYPPSFDIILGEGNCDNFFESEWDSISISDIKKIEEPTKEHNHYIFPKKEDFLVSLKNANNQLIEFCEGFLNEDLEAFYKARILTNGKTKPEKIIKKDIFGNVTLELLPYNIKKKNE